MLRWRNTSSWRLFRSRKEIDDRISLELGGRLERFHVHARELPGYRFVDLYRAVEQLSAERPGCITIESEHDEDLNGILHGKAMAWTPRRIKGAPKTAWPVGPEEEASLPTDSFRLCKESAASAGDALIFRVRYFAPRDRAIVEVAGIDPKTAEATVVAIVERSAAASIYRGAILELAFQAASKDEYGDIDTPERVKVRFKALEPVTEEDFVADDEVRRILIRKVVDLHLRRELLKAHGVPVRRGILLYGPPGTGKTFACRYVLGKLEGITRIVLTGTALAQVTPLFALARLLQPALVVLEDVDLVFAVREAGLYNSALGELLDQMDGLRRHDDVSFLLTTNALDRVEAAIRDRPGRISQLIHVGPPRPELRRRRYLLRYLRDYPSAGALDVTELVRQSEGATQAFLKEWVHRAVQFATERLGSEAEALALRDEDFHAAMKEMRTFSEGSTSGLIGFLGR